MSKLNEMTTLAYVKGSMAVDRAKTKAKSAIVDFNSDERGVEGFVVALILIGIAAIAALVFKKALVGEDGNSGIVGDLIDKIKELLGIS